MRGIFSDGWNSAAHVALGLFAGGLTKLQILLVSKGFLVYEILEKDEANLLVDISEYGAGLLIRLALINAGYS